MTRTEQFAVKVSKEYGLEIEELIELIVQAIITIIEACPQANLLPNAVRQGVTRFQRVKTRHTVYTVAKCCYPQFKSESGEIANSILDQATREEDLESIVEELTDDNKHEPA